MTKFEVYLTSDAETDVLDIADFVDHYRSSERADQLFCELKRVVLSLEDKPTRGRFVPELHDAGITDYREVIHGVYRVVYYIAEKTVYVIAVFDGRRDVADLLRRRLLR